MPTTTVRRLSEFSEPVYRAEDVNAELMAEDLSAIYQQIKRLNMAPNSNQRDLARLRNMAAEILVGLVAYHECGEKGLA